MPRGALVLAGAVPLLLLHADYQPQVALALGGTTLDVKLSDLAIAAVVAAAALAARGGARVGGLRLLLPGALFLVLALVGVAVGAARLDEYATATHLVTALVWVEYGALALAVPLLVRGAPSLRLVLWSLAVALALFDAVALLQFAGLDWETPSAAGSRQPSLVGFHDLGAAGGVALALGLVGVATRPDWAGGRLVPALCGAGLVGVILSGSIAAGLGLVLAAVIALWAARRAGVATARRSGLVAVLVAVAVVGIVLLRGGDLGDFARFVGLLPEESAKTEHVQTYSHRTLLGYLGLRVAADNPVLGAGWQASTQYETLEPYLGDARRRFPGVAEQAFPSRGVAYGVQNAYVQALADLGPLGLGAFLAALGVPLAAGARAGARRAPAALAGAATIAVCAGVWTALGLVGGIPTLAFTCLGIGLVLASRSALPDG